MNELSLINEEYLLKEMSEETIIKNFPLIKMAQESVLDHISPKKLIEVEDDIKLFNYQTLILVDKGMLYNIHSNFLSYSKEVQKHFLEDQLFDKAIVEGLIKPSHDQEPLKDGFYCLYGVGSLYQNKEDSNVEVTYSSRMTPTHVSRVTSKDDVASILQAPVDKSIPFLPHSNLIKKYIESLD